MSFSKGLQGDESAIQVQSAERKKVPGYVKRKIRASTPKHRGEVSRARIAGERLFKRAEKKLTALLEDVPDEYLDRALRRLGEQLNATKKIWDLNAKCLIDIPDEKIRQDAALAILAYKWGRPVERAQVLHAQAEDFPSLIEKLRQSPIAREKLGSSLLEMERKQSAPASAEPP